MASRFDYRDQYDDVRDAIEREDTKTINLEPPLTQQHHAESADLNVIVARFAPKDVSIPLPAANAAYYGDFTDVPDFRTALDNTRIAIERFNALPAAIRNRFDNDPLKLYAFVNDPSKTEEAVQLGILSKVNFEKQADADKPSDVPAGTRT